MIGVFKAGKWLFPLAGAVFHQISGPQLEGYIFLEVFCLLVFEIP